MRRPLLWRAVESLARLPPQLCLGLFSVDIFAAAQVLRCGVRGAACGGGGRSAGNTSVFTLVTGPRRSLSLKLSDARVHEPQIRARLGTTAHFCEVIVPNQVRRERKGVWRGWPQRREHQEERTCEEGRVEGATRGSAGFPFFLSERKDL